MTNGYSIKLCKNNEPIISNIFQNFKTSLYQSTKMLKQIQHNKTLNFFYFAFFILLLSGYSSAQYKLEAAYPNLTFQAMTDFQNAGDGTNRVFVIEQAGRIKVFENSSGASSSKTFLDITDRVTSGGEMGILGLAFHPDYEKNGYFYVDYTTDNPRQTHISRFKVTSNPDSADKASELILLSVDQPFPNHKGGQTTFGPDGYLYVGFGDGGSGGDPNNNAQNLGTLLGKIIRINVDSTQDGLNYTIPGDNPFAASLSARGEIYAYGLRNPWRFSFDSGGKIWCADVGQGDWEEVDTIQKGFNYGWRIMEGTHCYNPSSNCDTAGLTFPIYEYQHNTPNGGNSITGGYVYEGAALPTLKGRYIFADYVSRRIWSLGYYGINPDQPVIELLLTASAGITTFGVDENKELYVCLSNGLIYNIVSTATSIKDNNIDINSFELLQNYPNPFNPSTNITFILGQPSFINLKVYDVLGKEITTLLDKEMSEGRHQLNFSLADFTLTSGVYYVKMNGETLSSRKSFQQVIKIMYLK